MKCLRTFTILLLGLFLLSAEGLQAGNDDIKVPRSFLNLLFAEQDDWTVFVTELSSQKAYLYTFERDAPRLRLIKEFNIASGKQKGSKRSEWDLRTPTGFYQITQFRQPHTLHEKFGTGAFILDYPNPLDKALLRTGSGIWIHGTDRDDFIDFDSEGCVRMKNDDIIFLRDFLEPRKTPVIIVDDIQWITLADLLQIKNEWRTSLDEWSEAIDSGKPKEILQFYHQDFRDHHRQKDLARWKLHVNNNPNDLYPPGIMNPETNLIFFDDYFLIQYDAAMDEEEETDPATISVLWKDIDGQHYIILNM